MAYRIVVIDEAEHGCSALAAFGNGVFELGGHSAGRHRQCAKTAEQNLGFGWLDVEFNFFRVCGGQCRAYFGASIVRLCESQISSLLVERVNSRTSGL